MAVELSLACSLAACAGEGPWWLQRRRLPVLGAGGMHVAGQLVLPAVLARLSETCLCRILACGAGSHEDQESLIAVWGQKA